VTQRERFLRYLRFEPVDRVPLMDMGVWPETFERWHAEGLPQSVRDLRDLEAYLDLDLSFNLNWLPIQLGVFPPFQEEILEETEEDWVLRDGTGVLMRKRKRAGSIPHYIRFPIEDETDYEALLPRLDGADPNRYPDGFDADLARRRQAGEIVGINFQSFFGFWRNHMGAENWCMAFLDRPELVRRMIADRLGFARVTLKRLLNTGALDFVQVWEDMCFKTASLISPEHIRRHMLPAYVELVSLFREAGVELILVDSDGYVGELLPVVLEAGMDGIHPCEMAAGSDPLILRQQHRRCALIGGMDKRAIASGRAGVDAELERLRPVLEQGGFIPMLDHFVPPDVSYADYCYYVDRRRALLSRPHPGGDPS
jgi:uroporphyrinogen decarboxylase